MESGNVKMITMLENEHGNHSHLRHSKFSFMLSRIVDSTSNHGKGNDMRPF